MKHVGLHEAKTHLSEIIANVCEGREYLITRRGIPVARLLPAAGTSTNIEEAVTALNRLADKNSLKGLNTRELIDEGRR